MDSVDDNAVVNEPGTCNIVNFHRFYYEYNLLLL